MSDTRKATAPSKAHSLNAKLTTAKQDYKCETCNGEFPIGKGAEYVSMSVKADGKLRRHKICMRCWMAIKNKQAHGKANISLLPGSLRWAALSHHFREDWTRLKMMLLLWGELEGEKKAAMGRKIAELQKEMTGEDWEDSGEKNE